LISQYHIKHNVPWKYSLNNYDFVVCRYRLTVLKALPRLEKLDDVPVQPEEVQDALRKGRDLVHPDDLDDVPETPPQRPRVPVSVIA